MNQSLLMGRCDAGHSHALLDTALLAALTMPLPYRWKDRGTGSPAQSCSDTSLPKSPPGGLGALAFVHAHPPWSTSGQFKKRAGKGARQGARLLRRTALGAGRAKSSLPIRGLSTSPTGPRGGSNAPLVCSSCGRACPRHRGDSVSLLPTALSLGAWGPCFPNSLSPGRQ